MKFTVVTPSFGQLAYLKLNAASIVDQRRDGVVVEHIVQDGGSKDGTRDWLLTRPDIQGIAEADDGMYDAINRGIIKGDGDVFSWLNCDEQYLPGALAEVRDFFNAHPKVDIAVGHTVVVDPDGEYMCHRKAVVPLPGILRRGRLPVHSSSMFFRRHLVKGPGAVLFDKRWKAMGDWAWLKELMEKGARVAKVEAFISTFTDTGGNLGMSPRAREESKRVEAALTSVDRLVTPLVRMDDYARKIASGYYQQAPFDYALYRPDPSTPDGVSAERRTVHVSKPTFIWKGHMMVL
ncbi:MAG: glycosyltransferase [Flavobacteriales bacterium]